MKQNKTKYFHFNISDLENYSFNQVMEYTNRLEVLYPTQMQQYKPLLLRFAYDKYIQENNFHKVKYNVFVEQSNVLGYAQNGEININLFDLSNNSFFAIFAIVVHEQQHIEQQSNMLTKLNNLNNLNKNTYVNNNILQSHIFSKFINNILFEYETYGSNFPEDAILYDKLLQLNHNFVLAKNNAYGNLPWEIEAREKSIIFMKNMCNRFPENNKLKKETQKLITLHNNQIKQYQQFSTENFLKNFYIPVLEISSKFKDVSKQHLEYVKKYSEDLSKFGNTTNDILKISSAEIEFYKNCKTSKNALLLRSLNFTSKRKANFISKMNRSKLKEATIKQLAIRRERMKIGKENAKARLACQNYENLPSNEICNNVELTNINSTTTTNTTTNSSSSIQNNIEQELTF